MAANRYMSSKEKSDTSSLHSRVAQKKGSGVVSKELPSAVRSEYESRYGYSSRGLHVIESDLPDSLGVEALTQGNTIHFSHGNYNPSSTHGKTVLNHELGHTVQQAKGGVSPNLGGVINHDPVMEHRASNSLGSSPKPSSGGASLSQLPSGSSSSPIQCWWHPFRSKQGDLQAAQEELMKYYEEQAKIRAKKQNKYRALGELAQSQFADETAGGFWERRKAKKKNESIRNAQSKLEHHDQKQLFIDMMRQTHQLQRLATNSRGYNETEGRYEGGGDEASNAGVPTLTTGTSGAKVQQRLEAAVGGLGLDIGGGLAVDAPGYLKKAADATASGTTARGYLDSVSPVAGEKISGFLSGANDTLHIPAVMDSLRYGGGGAHAIGGFMEMTGAAMRANKARKAGDTATAWQAGLSSLAGGLSGAQGVGQMVLGGAATAGGLAGQVLPGIGAATGAANFASGIAGVVANRRTEKASEAMLRDERLAAGYNAADDTAVNDYETLNMLRNAAYTRKVEAGFDIATGALDTAAGVTNALGGGSGAGAALTGLSVAGKIAKYFTGKGMRSHYASKETGALMQARDVQSVWNNPLFHALSKKEKEEYLSRASGAKDKDQLHDRMQVSQAMRLHADIHQEGGPSETNRQILAAMGYKDSKKYKHIDVQMLAAKLGFTGNRWANAVVSPEVVKQRELFANVAKAQAAVDKDEEKKRRKAQKALPQDATMSELRARLAGNA